MVHLSKFRGTLEFGHQLSVIARGLSRAGLAMCRTLVLSCLLLHVSSALAQTAETPAEIQSLNLVRDGENLKIEITVSTPRSPAVLMLSAPDRLVLEFANTTADARQQRIPVDSSGVSTIRVGLNSSKPPKARVVLDLNRVHPYAFSTTGNKVVLTVLSEKDHHNRVSRVAVDSAPFLGIFFRRQKRASAEQSAVSSQRESFRTVFKVKAIAQGEAYIDGGRRSGLAEGMRLIVRDATPADVLSAKGRAVAVLRVISVAGKTAVTKVEDPQRGVKPGDWAFLSAEDTNAIITARRNSEAPGAASGFVEEAENAQSRPQSTEQGHLRGRVGFDTSSIRSSGSTPGQSQTVGLMLRGDMTRILGTHWNLQGYWRTRSNKSTQPLQNTMQYYLDRNYTMQLYYDNPDSKWVAGVGRLYLPWASVLDTIDGGYVGRKVGKNITAGAFFGSIPDLNTWHYSPNQRIAGDFINFEGGSYESFHYSSTLGTAFSTVKWRLERPYGFLENNVSYKKYFSIYHSFVVDDPQGLTTDGITPGAGVSRSYLAVHTQPFTRIGFDVVHNYFRDVPTLSTALISTGLVDKLLYQGVLGTVHVQVTPHLTLYTSLGHSKKTGDAQRSMDQVYGATWSDVGLRNTRVDYHYSKFVSSFAQGSYQILSFSRYFTNWMLWDTQVGYQDLVSGLSVNNRSTFLDTSFDTDLGSHSYVQSGYTVSRGSKLNYYQWYLSLGYRFNARMPTK